MKISNWCKTLSKALVAGGLLAPISANAAPTNTNLLVNPGFENVDLAATSSFYNAPKILDWSIGSGSAGFAYSHDGSSSNTGVVPDYANGPPLAGGGHWYFAPGNSSINTLAEALNQDIDVSTGPSAAVIGTGTAPYVLSAFFDTFSTQNDRGIIQLDFLGPANTNLGTTQLTPPPPGNLQSWTQFATSGLLPVGTQTVHVSIYGFVASGSTDGYMDNLSFSIVPEPSSMVLMGAGLIASAMFSIRRRDDD
jgi:hypothetical protein